MKVYWCPQSRASRVIWLLEESGLPYERIHIEIHEPQARADPAFRAASPMGKVPAIEDGSTRLWDSGAIACYVADQYPAAQLAPRIGDPLRGAYLQWLVFNNSVLEPALCEKTAGLPANPRQYGWGSWELALEVLRAGLEAGPWILGERFSAADVLLGSSAHHLGLFGVLGDEPAMARYVERCAARPAFQRAQKLDVATA